MTVSNEPSSSAAQQVFAIIDRYEPAVTAELHRALDGKTNPPYTLMRYHFGWEDESGRSIEARKGKLLRPALCLLACEALGGDWQEALPAAAALEPGQHTAEPVQTQFGWHVIKLEDRRKSEPVSLEEIEPQLREQLARGALETVLDGLRDGVVIESVSASAEAQ